MKIKILWSRTNIKKMLFFFWEVMKWVCLVFSRFKTSGCHFVFNFKICLLVDDLFYQHLNGTKQLLLEIQDKSSSNVLLQKAIIEIYNLEQTIQKRFAFETSSNIFFFLWNKEYLNNFYINVSPECCCFKYPPKYYRNKPNLFFFWHAKGRKQKRFV